VLGTPQLLGQLLGADWASWAWSHGSHSLVAPGVGLAADMSGGLTLLAVLEYVNYFHWQISYDSPSEIRYLLRHRRLKRATLVRDLEI